MSGGRRREVVVVPDWGGRDAGKLYRIEEWPAARAERWGEDMLIALKGSGAELAESCQGMGMVGVAFAGLNAFLRAAIDRELLHQLLDDMLTCVSVVRDPKHPEVATPISSDDDIEEVRTRLWLRSEVLRVHTNFSTVAALLTWVAETSTQGTSGST